MNNVDYNDSDKTFYQIILYIYTQRCLCLLSIYKCKLSPAFIYNGNKNPDVYSSVNPPQDFFFFFLVFLMPSIMSSFDISND